MDGKLRLESKNGSIIQGEATNENFARGERSRYIITAISTPEYTGLIRLDLKTNTFEVWDEGDED